MAVQDFTGKNIQDTYQRVVQTDGTNLADGTGSLLPISFDGNNVIISGSLTATEYSVTSSVTNVIFQQQSGSTIFGDSVDDTHKFTGKITASGAISSSGAVTTTQLRANGRIYPNYNLSSGHFIRNTSTTNPIVSAVGGFHTNGNITASGDISSSGDTTLNNLTVHGTQFTNRIDRIDNEKIGVQFGDGINVSGGHITASGDISSSGDIVALNINGIINGGNF